MKRQELFKSPIYWTTLLQTELYRQIEDFMQKKNMNKSQLAEYLGCSKGYVTQLLSGDFDHKLSKFMELSLAIGKIPQFEFTDLEEFVEDDKQTFNSVKANSEFSKMTVYTNKELINIKAA